MTIREYDDEWDNMFKHITNYDIQLGHTKMTEKDFRDARKWNLTKLQNYIIHKGLAGTSRVEDCLMPAQKRAIVTVFNATKDKLKQVPLPARSPSFRLFGADLILDDRLQLWLTEVL